MTVLMSALRRYTKAEREVVKDEQDDVMPGEFTERLTGEHPPELATAFTEHSTVSHHSASARTHQQARPNPLPNNCN